MKKKFITIASIVAVLVLVAIIYINNTVKYVTIPSERIILADDFVELEKESDLIIRATVMPGKENILIKNKYDDSVIFGYTITELKIIEMLFGEIKEEKIKITEEYYYTIDLNGKTIWTQGEYLPAKEKKEYIFFLKKYDDNSNYKGMYYPIDLEKGKYVIGLNKVEELTEKELEIMSKKNLKEYKKWYKEVMKKYKN